MGVRFGAEEFCKYDALMCAYDMLYHNQMRKPVYKKKKKKIYWNLKERIHKAPNNMGQVCEVMTKR